MQTPAGPARGPTPRPSGATALGVAALGVAASAAAALSLRHLALAPLPGCALDSACERALGGPFGTLPLFAWPVAFAGAAFFAGELAAWSLARDGWPRSLRWVARLGGAASLGFLVLAFVQGTPCPYCIAAQLANLAFVALSERAAGPARARRPEAAFALAALAVTGALALARGRHDAQRGAAAERELAESTREAARDGGSRAFTGRHRRGPELAAVRLVMFTDYQCPDCARVESDAWALVSERDDVSLSIKHFPLDGECNRRARELGRNPHPNACWAARAAEAASMVGGEDGFWRMHRWLFERGGSFVDAELHAGLAELGFAPGPFLEAMHGAETLARVRADVDEALALGIQSTPLVFLNGVELRGWRAPDALRRAVLALAATATAGSAESDRPPGALDKALQDWRAEPLVELPARAGRAPAEIELWSDYLDPGTRDLDRALRELLASRPGLRYSFRHYPLDPECVAGAPNAHPGACLAARAAEAAGIAGGEPARERVHAWLMGAKAPLDEAALRGAAEEAGLDWAAFSSALAGQEAARAVRGDVEAARRVGIHAIPLLFVAGRRVPRWRVEGEPVLERILDEAFPAR